MVGVPPGGHFDAVNDGAHTHTERTASAVVSHVGQVCLGVKGDGLGEEFQFEMSLKWKF